MGPRGLHVTKLLLKLAPVALFYFIVVELYSNSLTIIYLILIRSQNQTGFPISPELSVHAVRDVVHWPWFPVLTRFF